MFFLIFFSFFGNIINEFFSVFFYNLQKEKENKKEQVWDFLNPSVFPCY